MLVLSRKTTERIVISTPEHDIVLVVVRIDGSTVRLGFEAEKEVRILREEVKERDDRRQND